MERQGRRHGTRKGIPKLVKVYTERKIPIMAMLTHLVPISHRLPYEAPRGNGDNTVTVSYMQGGQPLYPDKKLLFPWDGASYHRGEDMQQFLAQENAGLPEAEGQVTCVRFAPNAPEQNPGEDVWLKGKTHLRKQFALNKMFAQVKACFSSFLNTLRFTSTKFSWYWPTAEMI